MIRVAKPSVRILSLMALAALVGAGCGGDSTPSEPEGVTIGDLVGSWNATSVLLTNKANPAQQFDIVAAGGELRMTVLVGGRVRTWLDLGDFSDEWDSLLSIDGNQLTSTPSETSRQTRRYTFTLAGDVLTATRSDASFDFTLSGGPEVPATEVTVLRRQ